MEEDPKSHNKKKKNNWNLLIDHEPGPDHELDPDHEPDPRSGIRPRQGPLNESLALR